MKRLAIDNLEKWNRNPRRKPLMVWGARQVGKTYLIRDQFAKEYFPDRYVYVDFALDRDIREFCMSTVDPGKIIQFISAVRGVAIRSDTLLIFDEIQECPAIITALKYFCQDYREYPVIATGSMVRIKLKRRKRGPGKAESFLFPVGKIDELTLYPVSFEEYLLNKNPQQYEMITESWQKKEPLAPAYHDLAMNLLYSYLLVGGMPEALQTFMDTGDYHESRIVLQGLYNNYLSDMELYQASPESVLRSKAIFSQIYSELNKENKDFRASLVEEKARTRDMETPIDWLTTACVVQQSWQTAEHVTAPLRKEDNAAFRLYLNDIGMFTYQSRENAATFLLKDKKNMLSGIFFENYVANELTAYGVPLFYWKGKKSAEMEFVAELSGRMIPIDVKRGRGKLNSLKAFRDHNVFDTAVKISDQPLGYAEELKLLTVPLYGAFLLAKELGQCSQVSI